jgi:hypothetical protein
MYSVKYVLRPRFAAITTRSLGAFLIFSYALASGNTNRAVPGRAISDDQIVAHGQLVAIC